MWAECSGAAESGRVTRLYRVTFFRRTIPRVIAPSASPPYALATPAFPFPALAALAGRATLGGGREIALACFLSARLAAGMLAATPISATARAGRAVAARAWLGALTLPAASRVLLARLMDATAGEDTKSVAAALARVLEHARPNLERGAREELEGLLAALQR